jgi:hypothetical protein
LYADANQNTHVFAPAALYTSMTWDPVLSRYPTSYPPESNSFKYSPSTCLQRCVTHNNNQHHREIKGGCALRTGTPNKDSSNLMLKDTNQGISFYLPERKHTMQRTATLFPSEIHNTMTHYGVKKTTARKKREGEGVEVGRGSHTQYRSG